VVGELLADWDGELTEQTRDLVAWHIEQCQTCANHGRGALRPTALSGLLPLAPLPTELRARVLSRCSSTDADAVAYRQRVVRRAESTWLAMGSQAIRRMSWNSIRANPGPAIAATAIALWVLAAVVVTLLTFAGTRAAHAQVTQPTGVTSLRRPTAAPSSASARASAKVTPAPATRKLAARGLATVRPSPSYSYAYSPSPSPPSSPKPPKPPKPSKSPSPKPSKSPPAKASPSTSPKPSKSPSPKPSSPSATP
jgi:hypothetical protein